eukprot:gene18658-21848_t
MSDEPSPESEELEQGIGPKVGPKVGVIRMDVGDVIPVEERITNAWNENALRDHLEKFLLAADNHDRTFVYSAPPGQPHLYCFAPSVLLRRNYWTIVTMGMSGTRMNVPEFPDADDYARAELLCYLPSYWKFPPGVGTGELDENNWPLEMLRSYVRYVTSMKAWVSKTHGLPNLLSTPQGQPFIPLLPFSHVVLFPTDLKEKPGFSVAEVDGEKVNFYAVIP